MTKMETEKETMTRRFNLDGYIGWALSMHLAKRGHIVSGIDNFARRANVLWAR
jgi:hypothetical protein